MDLNVPPENHCRSTPGVGKGFSLVEMLMVVAVIGTILAIAIPNLWDTEGSRRHEQEQREKAEAREEAARRKQIDLIKEALREYAKEAQ